MSTLEITLTLESSWFPTLSCHFLAARTWSDTLPKPHFTHWQNKDIGAREWSDDDPMDCSPPGSSVHGILQARILEWVVISFSRGSKASIYDYIDLSFPSIYEYLGAP